MIETAGIYLAAVIHGLFQITVLLFNRRGNRRANAMLAFLIGLVILTIWNFYVYSAGLSQHWILVDYYLWGTIFFWGPALYFYVGIMSAQVDPNRSQLLRHFSIAILLILFQLPVHFLSQNGWLGFEQIEVFNSILLLAFYIQMSLYFYGCFQMLQAYDRELKNNYSYIGSVNLSWLKRLTAIFAAIIAVDMILTVPATMRSETYPYIVIYMTAEAVVVFVIGYFSLSHSEALFHSSRGEDRSKYNGASLDDSLATSLVEKLNVAMQESQAYKKNDLRLSDLAEMVGVSRQLLSQLINQHCGKNFYDFVNEYRVRLAAERLLADERANIEKVAFDVGFNNRVSFNNAFKKYMRMTPSQYRRGQGHESLKPKLQQRTASSL